MAGPGDRTVLVIDGADNCAYDLFAMPAALFAVVFPGEGQDVAFIEDVLDRHPDGAHDELFADMWRRPVLKRDVRGIDGLLFYDLPHKRAFYPNRRDSDLDRVGRAFVTARR